MAWYAILLAGGSGSRMGAGRNKCLLTLEGEPVLCRSMAAFRGLVSGVVLVTRPEDEEECRAAISAWHLDDLLTECVCGGSDRQASVANGLEALPADCDCVLVHDAARALVTQDVIRLVMDSVKRCGTGVAAIPVVDTIKEVDDREITTSTPDRASLRAVQTPQGFTTELLKRAHAQADADGFRGTDDASLVERLGVAVQLTHGSADNLKLTTPRDLELARVILAAQKKPTKQGFRVGQGYDVHRLAADRRLVLCGVEVPHETGLLGHSDADVALHALMDALLGALALGDIGKHFPDTDPAYAGISSMKLTEHVAALLKRNGARVLNVDVTIVAQRPKLAAYIPLMRQNVARVLDLDEDYVSVKATTTERLGFEGEEKGISAQAVCLVEKE